MNSPRVAIIADDLTGALDVCAPFARRGLLCLVAVTLEGLPDILQRQADVVCVNTASRERDVYDAVAIMAEAAAHLAGASPAIAFQKIDSRFKGHVAEGIDTLMASFRRTAALVAPAVPAQGRFVRDGHVVGMGVAKPIDIASRLGRRDFVTIADSGSDAEMEQLARQHMHDALLVGASGLGAGLAQALTGRAVTPLLEATKPMLIAIGSHDPATLAQVARLRAQDGIATVETVNGNIESILPADGVTLVRAVSDTTRPDHAATMARFGLAVAEQLRGGRFASALLCGGETAHAVLDALGISTLALVGEALPGVPVSQAQLAGRQLMILTKSGGFGTPDDLLHIARAARPATPPIDPNRAGIPA